MNFAKLLARRALQIEASGIRKIFDQAATLKDPIDLSVGQPDYAVPEPVQNAAIAAIRAGFNRYTPSGGIPELRRALRERYERSHGVSLEDAVVTSGVSGALTLALLALVDPGDEVLVPDPYFVSYKHLTVLCGGTPVYYDTYPDFQIDVRALDALVTPKTKVLLAMSPGNPTGACIGESTKKELADFARRKGLVLISDEIYSLFTYADEHSKLKIKNSKITSLGAYYPEGTLVLDGLSKSAALTGWRIGWALGPQALVEEMTKLQQFTFVHAPSFTQKAALAALETDLTAAVPVYRKKRDFMLAGLRAAGYRVAEPGGAFYLFAQVPPAYPHAQAFVEAALRAGLLLVPGQVFSRRDTHVRISYAAADQTLSRALEVFQRLAQQV